MEFEFCVQRRLIGESRTWLVQFFLLSPTLGSALYSTLLAKIGLSCCEQRMNVVRRDSSFNRAAPTYVQQERRPPSMSRTSDATGPLYITSTVLPSLARYLLRTQCQFALGASHGSPDGVIK